MIGLLRFLSLVGCACATLHHIYVGQSEGSSLYALEIDDVARTVYMMGIIPAVVGGSPNLVLTSSKVYLFGSRPSDGTVTRYAVQPDYSLKNEGTGGIPASCNTTKFNSIHLSTIPQSPLSIFGAATTGTCSTLFAMSLDGFNTLSSKNIAGDIRSLAWSPSGRNLHALDSHSSTTSTTSIFNFYIADEPTLETQNGTDILSNITNAEQIISHPTGKYVYLVTRNTNELVSVPLTKDDHVNGAATPSRFRILPSSIDASQYTTSSLAISHSKSTLWTLSLSSAQAIVTVWSLNTTTGEVIDAVTRASWKGMGGIGTGQLAAANFEAQDMMAVSNSPVGMVAFLGLDTGVVPAGHTGVVTIAGDDFLDEVSMLNVEQGAAAAPKIKSFGRIDLGMDSLGEGVWVD